RAAERVSELRRWVHVASDPAAAGLARGNRSRQRPARDLAQARVLHARGDRRVRRAPSGHRARRALVLRLRRPSSETVQRLLAYARSAAMTYPEVGATRALDLPGGYRHDRYEIRLGRGQEIFE